MRNNERFERLKGAVLEMSVSDDWEYAKGEWAVSDLVVDSSGYSGCVCGKEGIKNLFTIKNRFNGNTIYPIGSTCIRRFECAELNYFADAFRQAQRLVDAAAVAGHGDIVGLESGLYSRKLIDLMHAQRVFWREGEPRGDADKRAALLLKAFNARNADEELEEKANEIIREYVYPWLRKLFLRNKSVTKRKEI